MRDYRTKTFFKFCTHRFNGRGLLVSAFFGQLVFDGGWFWHPEYKNIDLTVQLFWLRLTIILATKAKTSPWLNSGMSLTRVVHQKNPRDILFPSHASIGWGKGFVFMKDR